MYKSSLDGIRSFCIFFTVCNHIKGAPAFIDGSVGVDIFFALSGFLITHLLLAEEQSRGRIDLSAFYIRRLFRIAPLYYLTMLLYFVSSYLLSTQKPDFKHAGAFENSFWWLLSFNKEYQPADSPGVFGHAWTLGIEEKFYILWPLLICLLGARRNIGYAIAVALLAIGALWYLAGFSELVLRGYAGLTFGASMSMLLRHNAAVARIFAEQRLAAFALAGATLSYIALLRSESVGCNLLISFFGAILVASLWCNASQPVGRFLSVRPLAYLGKLTYSLYLIHVLVINVVLMGFARLQVPQNFYLVFLTAYAGSVACSSALHRFVEQPLIRQGKRLAGARLPETGVRASRPGHHNPS